MYIDDLFWPLVATLEALSPRPLEGVNAQTSKIVVAYKRRDENEVPPIPNDCRQTISCVCHCA